MKPWEEVWRPVRSKTGLAATRSRMMVHRTGLVEALVADDRIHYTAQWICAPADNYHWRSGVVLVADPEPFGGICPRCESIYAGPTVYRCYNAADALLYVGSTADRRARIQGHSKKKPWWPEVTRVEYEDFADLTAARGAESQAIATESPRYNRYGTREPAA